MTSANKKKVIGVKEPIIIKKSVSTQAQVMTEYWRLYAEVKCRDKNPKTK